jgi:hypothetical protein
LHAGRSLGPTRVTRAVRAELQNTDLEVPECDIRPLAPFAQPIMEVQLKAIFMQALNQGLPMEGRILPLHCCFAAS